MEKLNQLLELNVNEYAEKKGKFTYLSWSLAWKEFIKVYPAATYTIKKDDNGVPVFGNDAIGYMCYTEVTAGEVTHEMWLPVMNGANKAMKAIPYSYKTKYGEKQVEPMTMFDVNKTVMRCLTKNLAMFGLGLYIYAGEDLPEDEPVRQSAPKPDARHEIFNLLETGKVPAADKEAYITKFKADSTLLNAKTVAEIKAKYFA